jgi:hypothetical protein
MRNGNGECCFGAYTAVAGSSNEERAAFDMGGKVFNYK